MSAEAGSRLEGARARVRALLASRRSRTQTRRERLRGLLRLRQLRRTAQIVAVAVLGGLAAAWFAKLCDLAMAQHAHWVARAPGVGLILLPFGLAAAAALTRKFAPEAAGSGIPQVIAAADGRWRGRWGGQRVTLRTAAAKVAISAGLLLCGASIGREGPTVQVLAGIVRSLTRGLKGGPGRRAMIVAGGAAGVSAAFNAPIAGVVFAFEELARGFDRRTHTTVILVVVVAGFTAYALHGDYAYFGELHGGASRAAWLAAPLIGAVAGLSGGLFARVLRALLAPGDHPIGRFREARPIAFAAFCGAAALAAALASEGATYGAGYAQTQALLHGHLAQGAGFAFWKAIASLAASASGAPGGIFAPSLTTGAGIGAAFAAVGPWMVGRDAVVLGMTSYLAGVTHAPLTSAVILMEMTRDPGLVGPLMLAALIGRWASGLITPEPLYHALSQPWRRPSERLSAR